MKNKIVVNHCITLSSNNFRLTILVDDNLKSDEQVMGFFEYVGLGSKDIHQLNWDALEWFIDIDKTKKEELKNDLVIRGIPPKGKIKEIKELIKEALKLKLL